MDPINLAPIDIYPPGQEPLPPIDLTPTTAPLSPELANTRAYKVSVGNSLDKPYDEVRDALVSGKEDELRAEAAANVDARRAKSNQDKLIKLASTKATLTPEDTAFMTGTKPMDAGSVFEQMYGQEVLNELDKSAERNPDSFWAQARIQFPQFVEATKEAGSEVVAKREYALTKHDNVAEEIKNQGWGGFLADLAPRLLFQPYNEFMLRGNVPEVSKFKGMIGTNLEEQRKELYRLPFDQYKEKLDAIVENLKSRNPQVAKDFLEAMAGTTSASQFLASFSTLLAPFDISAVYGLGKGVAKLGQAGVQKVVMANDVRLAVKDVLKAAEGTPTKENIIAATGDLSEAAVQTVKKDTLQSFKGTNDAQKEAIEALPSALRSDAAKIEANPGRLSAPQVNMLKEQINTFADNILNKIATVSKVLRVPLEQASEEAIRSLKAEVKDKYPGLNNAILDISDPIYHPISNVYSVDMKIGNHGSTMFTNPEIAKNFAIVNGLGNAKVSKQGWGYYLTVNKPLDETSSVMRDILVNTEGSASRLSWKNGILGWLRTAEDTLAFNQNVNRKVATYAQSEYRTLADQQRQYIQDLKNGAIRNDPVTGAPISWFSRKIQNGVNYIGGTLTGKNKDKWQDLEQTLKANQRMYDADGLPGKFFEHPAELEDHYLRFYGRSPEFAEVQAYFAHKNLYELERIQQNLRVYTNKHRIGTESHTISVLDDAGQKAFLPTFDGVVRNHFPGGEDTILLLGERKGSEKITTISHLNTKTAERLREQVKTGQLKVVELYAPEHSPFEGWGKVKNERVRWVVAKNVESKPISFNQVPRRGGGHFEYEAEHYVKQARMRNENLASGVGSSRKVRHTDWYEGDTTIMPMAIRAKGRDVVDKMNAVRVLLEKGDAVAAEQLAKKTLPIEWEEFRDWFKPKLVNGKMVQRLSLKEPFVLTSKNKRIIDIDKSLEARYASTFKDGTRRGSLAHQYEVAFTGERDADFLKTVVDVGSRSNPLYKLEPAQMVDPIPMLNRSLSRMINSSFMDDYRISAVEHWIKEAGPLLKAETSELFHAPFYHFTNSNLAAFKGDADKAKVYSLLANRQKILQFVGTASKMETALHSAKQSLDDVTYKALGGYEGSGQGIKKKVALAPSWLLSRIHDPISFVRSMVYHEKLGLFAVPQILVQNMTYATIFALSPRAAIHGTFGAFMHQWSRVNPKMLDELDSLASKMGWKPGEWKEANALLNSSGFGHVGGEYINLDQLANYKVIQNAGHTFLDWGQVFFKEGEKNVRYGAWYTAFKEYRRDINPLGRITPGDLNKIVARADLLYSNMSRASSSTLHSGFFSLTTQFLSYQLRLAELFFSKRIGDTRGERMLARARIAGVYSTLFGVPAATGVTGIPFNDYIKKAAVDSGYVVGDNWINSAIMEGIPALFTAWVTGGGDTRKGNWYNIGERYGTPGFELIREILRGDKPWWTIVGGAAFGSLSNILGASDNFYLAMKSLRKGDGQFKLKTEDFIDPLKEVQSVNALWHTISTYNTGKWLSKKGFDLGPASPLNGVFMSLTGLQPSKVGYAYTKLWNMQDEHDNQKDALQKFIIEYKKGLEAGKDNPSQATDYFKRSMVHLIRAGYPEDKIDEAFATALKGNESLPDAIDWKYFTKNVPAGKEEQRLDALKRSLKLKQERGE